MAKRKHQKQRKLKLVLYLLGYRDHMDDRVTNFGKHHGFTNKEKRAYRKGRKAAVRAWNKLMQQSKGA